MKRNTSKLLSTLLVLCMVLALLPGTALADDDFVIEDSVLVKYQGDGGAVTIPGGVTSIGEEAFYRCESLTSVTIPDSVTAIGAAAFARCTNLASVTIPDSVTSIEDAAFSNCPVLTNVTIPDGVTHIGDSAFMFSGLTSVTIPASVVSFGEYVFSSCEELVSATISDGFTNIKNGTFAGCVKMTSVTIPASVTEIGSFVFQGCSSLTAINVANENTAYASIDGVLFSADKTLLHTYPMGKNGDSYVIPDTVVTIGTGAFLDSSLTRVTIPRSVTSIGMEAFANCVKLSDVTIPGSVTEIGARAFSYCSSLAAIQVSNENTVFSSLDGMLLSADQTILYVYPKGKETDSYTIPPMVHKIGEFAFLGADLTNITIPDNVTHIGFAAFSQSGLLRVIIPATVTVLEAQAFAGCSALKNATILGGIKTIEEYTFVECTDLERVTIPDSVTAIGALAFVACDKLTDVYYGGSESQWKQIEIDSTPFEDKNGNAPLLAAEKHYNSTGPETPGEPETPTAVLSPQKLTVNGEEKNCEKYNINDENYFKLRDLAYMLGGTGSKFSVDYDYASQLITIRTGQPYTPIGTELDDIVDRSETVVVSIQEIFIDSEKVSLTAYNIGGFNYFRLRDLGPILNFEVDFDLDTNTAIVKSK